MFEEFFEDGWSTCLLMSLVIIITCMRVMLIGMKVIIITTAVVIIITCMRVMLIGMKVIIISTAVVIIITCM